MPPRKKLIIYGKSTCPCGLHRGFQASGNGNGTEDNRAIGLFIYIRRSRAYGHNTSNVVEISNAWIVEEREFSVVDLLHAL